jgi:hypothetical protein
MQTPLSGQRSDGPICSSRLTGWSAGVASKGSPGVTARSLEPGAEGPASPPRAAPYDGASGASSRQPRGASGRQLGPTSRNREERRE